MLTTSDSPEGSKQQPAAITGRTAVEIALSDPLKAETRKARLYLLGVSMVGITIVFTGLVPQEITTLGITFEKADRQAILTILALVVLYFLAAFVVYGVSDFFQSRVAYATAYLSQARSQAALEMEGPVSLRLLDRLRGLPKDRFANGETSDHIAYTLTIRGEKFSFSTEAMNHEDVMEIWNDVMKALAQEFVMERYSRLSPIALWVRALFEFLLPIVVGIFAILALWWA